MYLFARRLLLHAPAFVRDQTDFTHSGVCSRTDWFCIQRRLFTNRRTLRAVSLVHEQTGCAHQACPAAARDPAGWRSEPQEFQRPEAVCALGAVFEAPLCGKSHQFLAIQPVSPTVELIEFNFDRKLIDALYIFVVIYNICQ